MSTPEENKSEIQVPARWLQKLYRNWKKKVYGIKQEYMLEIGIRYWQKGAAAFVTERLLNNNSTISNENKTPKKW